MKKINDYSKVKTAVDYFNEFKSHGIEFCNLMYARMNTDLLYYYGYGNKHEKYLWANDLKLQCEIMRLLKEFIEAKTNFVLDDSNLIDAENEVMNS